MSFRILDRLVRDGGIPGMELCACAIGFDLFPFRLTRPVDEKNAITVTMNGKIINVHET